MNHQHEIIFDWVAQHVCLSLRHDASRYYIDEQSEKGMKHIAIGKNVFWSMVYLIAEKSGQILPKHYDTITFCNHVNAFSNMDRSLVIDNFKPTFSLCVSNKSILDLDKESNYSTKSLNLWYHKYHQSYLLLQRIWDKGLE